MTRKNRHIPKQGEKFGRLTVLKKGEDKIDSKTGKRKSQYWCQCDCGSKEKLILGAALVAGTIKSCGCLHKEVASQTATTKISHGKKYNIYDLSREYGIGYTEKGEKFYFDLEDYDKIKYIYWNIDTRGYIVGHIEGSNKEIKLHQIVMPNTHKNIVIDHKNHSMKNDNRKSNLRLTLQSQNTRNKRIYNNGLINGVTLRNNKYIVTITKNKCTLYLGEYENLNDAIKIRLQAEIEFYGEYSSREIPEEYVLIKKDLLKLFKPVIYISFCNTEDFYNWINGKIYFDENLNQMTNTRLENSLNIVEYLNKYDKMELYFNNSTNNITTWGYFGLKLRDINDSCLIKAGLLDN